MDHVSFPIYTECLLTTGLYISEIQTTLENFCEVSAKAALLYIVIYIIQTERDWIRHTGKYVMDKEQRGILTCTQKCNYLVEESTDVPIGLEVIC